jgi:hypothetical protein
VPQPDSVSNWATDGVRNLLSGDAEQISVFSGGTSTNRVYNIEVRPVFRYNRTDHVNLFADSWRLARWLVLE